jgi:hypothetical protein
LPLLVVASLELLRGVSERSSKHCLFGAGCLIAAGLVGRVGGEPLPYRIPIGFHVALTAFLILGSSFEDALGRWSRNAGAALGVMGCLVVMLGPQGSGPGELPSWMVCVYPMTMGLVLAAYGRLLGHRESLYAAGAIIASWLAWLGWRGHRSIRHYVAGLDFIALGLVSFALAWVTSMVKGGKPPMGNDET